MVCRPWSGFLDTAHASFSGCDTVSSIYNGFGKVKVLKNRFHESVQEKVFEVFNNLRATKKDISEAGVKLVQYLYKDSDVSLEQLRYDKYNQLMAKGVFKPVKIAANIWCSCPTCTESLYSIQGLAVTSKPILRS